MNSRQYIIIPDGPPFLLMMSNRMIEATMMVYIQSYLTPQPPGSLVMWGTEWQKIKGLYKEIFFYEQWHQIP